MASPDPPSLRPGPEDRDAGRPPRDGPGGDGVTSQALDRFMRALARIGPIAPDELDLLITRFGPEGTEALARELVRTGRLTGRQAAAVLRGETEGPAIDKSEPSAAQGFAPPTRAPLSRLVGVVATAVLGLTAAAVVFDGRRVRTGELLVQSEGGAVRVTIRQAGRLIVPPSGKRSFTLLPGDYDVEIDGPAPGPEGSPRHVEVRRAAVSRHGRSVVTFARPVPTALTYPLDPVADSDATTPTPPPSPSR